MKMFVEFLDGEIAGLRERCSLLKNEGRIDEAHFSQIVLNIYDVCRTIYRVVSKDHSGEELRLRYLEKIVALPENWEKSLALAKLHGDHEKAAIEELKIGTLAHIRTRYLELEG